MKSGTKVAGTIIQKVMDGFHVDLNGFTLFLPDFQFEFVSSDANDDLTGLRFQFIVVKHDIDKNGNTVPVHVVSEKFFESLPHDIKNAVFGSETKDVIYKIGEKFNLQGDQIDNLLCESRLLVLGIIAPGDFISNISSDLAIDRKVARDIAVEIYQDIFAEIKETLMKIHNIDDEDNEKKEVAGMQDGIDTKRTKLSVVHSGKVRWWNDTKGFGFIAHKSGDDIFVHYSQIQVEGFRYLTEGQTVEFEVVGGPKGPEAVNVFPIKGEDEKEELPKRQGEIEKKRIKSNTIRSRSKNDVAETIRANGEGIISSEVAPSETGTSRGDQSVISSGVPSSSGDAIPQRSETGRADQPVISSGVPPTPPTPSARIISTGMPNVPYGEIILNDVKYFITKVLTRSTGEAEVYLAERNKRKYVFKLYYLKFKPKDSILPQLKGLEHNDIVDLVDYGYYGDRFFEVMAYAEGGSLLAQNEDGTCKYIPIKDANKIKQLVRETVNALDYCHQKGIIHKDIKPENIFFRNPDGTDILIGDFGISTTIEEGFSKRISDQSRTDTYAAPEIYQSVGGKTVLGREVDYYSLGISLIHMWTGEKPFKDLGELSIMKVKCDGKVDIPEDMPHEIKTLVKGLVTLDYTKRWGYDQVQRWLKGERVPIFYKPGRAQYNEFNFGIIESENVVANDPIELADLLEKYLEQGKKHLYKGTIQKWLMDVDQSLYLEIRSIVEDEHPSDEEAGLTKAIYVLDKDRPFKSPSGIICSTAEEMADALEKESAHYKKIFADPAKKFSNDFFQFLKARGEKDYVDKFNEYVKLYDPEVALNNIIFFLNPDKPYKLLPNIVADTPAELARQIYGKPENWEYDKIPLTYQEGLRQLWNESILAWLKRRKYDDMINKWGSIKSIFGDNKEAVLESFLRVMDPTLPKISLSISIDSKIAYKKGRARKWVVKSGNKDTAIINFRTNGCGIPFVPIRLEQKTPALDIKNNLSEINQRTGSIELKFDTKADNIPVRRNFSNRLILNSDIVELSIKEVPIEYKVGFPTLNTLGIFMLYGILFSIGAFGLRGFIAGAGFDDWLYNYFGNSIPFSRLVYVNISDGELDFLGNSNIFFFIVPFLLIIFLILFWLRRLYVKNSTNTPPSVHKDNMEGEG